MCGGFETKLKEQFKWFGQILSSGGLFESVAATVQDREGKIRGACLEIGQIINDWGVTSSWRDGNSTAALGGLLYPQFITWGGHLDRHYRSD